MTIKKHLTFTNIPDYVPGIILSSLRATVNSFNPHILWGVLSPFNLWGTKGCWAERRWSYVSTIAQVATSRVEMWTLAAWPAAHALHPPTKWLAVHGQRHHHFSCQLLRLHKRNSPRLVLSTVEWDFLFYFFQFRRPSGWGTSERCCWLCKYWKSQREASLPSSGAGMAFGD